MKALASHLLWQTGRSRVCRRALRRQGIRIDRDWYGTDRCGRVYNSGQSFLMANIGNELSCRSYWFEDYYEPLSMVAITAMASRIRTFVDVGANVGVFSLFAGSRVGDPTKLIAFEPNPKMRSILERNCILNHLSVEISPLALSDHAGEATFHLPASDTSGSLDEDFNPEVVSSYAVKTATLDQLYGADSCDPSDPDGKVLVKMDVLGHESSILRGSREFTGQSSPIYLLEAVSEFDQKEICFLEEAGYTFHLLLPHGLERMTEISGKELDGFYFGNFVATNDDQVTGAVDQALRHQRRTTFAETSYEGFDGQR